MLDSLLNIRLILLMKLKQTYHAIIGIAFAACGLGVARAAEPAWPPEPYRYVVVDQDLRLVLQEFGRNMNVRVVLSDAVQGRVRGRLPELAPRAFLEHLAQSYGLDWYFDGDLLSISGTGESVTHFAPLHHFAFARIETDLARTGLLDPRFALRPGPGDDMALVSGPPHYVQLVEQSIAALTAAKAPAAAQAGGSRGTLVIYRGSAPPAVAAE